jgi:hypothetical protein
VERSLDNGDTNSYTVTWLDEKAAVVGREVSLKHSDTGKPIKWTVAERWGRKKPPKPKEGFCG